MSDETVEPIEEEERSDPIAEMNETHVALGQKAAELAMQVLESVNVADIPVATAVSLLKFGVELQRKALLGVEPDDDGGDPFDALAKALGGQSSTPDEVKQEK